MWPRGAQRRDFPVNVVGPHDPAEADRKKLAAQGIAKKEAANKEQTNPTQTRRPKRASRRPSL
jgi:hypothetical protein